MTDPQERAVVGAHLDAVGRLVLPAIEATFADDVELVPPYAPPGFPKVSRGRAAEMEVHPEGLMDPVRFSDHLIDALEGRPGEWLAEDTSDTRGLTTGRAHRDNR